MDPVDRRSRARPGEERTIRADSLLRRSLLRREDQDAAGRLLPVRPSLHEERAVIRAQTHGRDRGGAGDGCRALRRVDRRCRAADELLGEQRPAGLGAAALPPSCRRARRAPSRSRRAGPSGTASPSRTGTASVPRTIPAIHTSDRPPVTRIAASRVPSRETAIATISEAPGQASATANCCPATENAVIADG